MLPRPVQSLLGDVLWGVLLPIADAHITPAAIFWVSVVLEFRVFQDA